MSKIAYDPVKDRFADIIRYSSFLRMIFYKLLDLFFLRSWYVRRVIKKYGGSFERSSDWPMLDAGCGFGQYDHFLLKHFSSIKITSIDIKDDYLEDCKHYFRDEIENGRICFEKHDLLKIDYENKFDFTICVDVLEHIEEDERVIQNLALSLKPGGYFLMHSPSHFAKSDAGDDETFVGEHARTGYSKKNITSKIQRAGLKPIEVRYTYGKSGHFAWELLIKYPMLMLNKIKLLALPFLLIYYIPILPVSLILMKIDMIKDNEWGTGIYALARKGEGGQ